MPNFTKLTGGRALRLPPRVAFFDLAEYRTAMRGMLALTPARRREKTTRPTNQSQRSGNSRRKVRNKGETTTRRPSLDLLGLVRPTAHELSRAGFPAPFALSCCGTYLQGGNGGVDVQGDSTTGRRGGPRPSLCRDQRPRVSSGKWQRPRPPGLPSCRTARLHKMAHTGALQL